MDQVVMLAPNETVRLDGAALEALFQQLGEAGAEDVVCRAMEELAVRLSHGERMFREAAYKDLRKNVRSLVAIAEQIGMQMLARIARDVTRCIDANDDNGMAACFARLLRVGERSLTEIWELQDLSI